MEILDDAVKHHGICQLQDGAVESEKKIRRALSLGPYGVALTDGSEVCLAWPNFLKLSNLHLQYTGVYPSLTSTTLESFHFCRLAALASSPCHWSRIDVLAFETIPRIDEVSAIRRAVARLYSEYAVERKPLWISCVHPHGRMPGWDLDEAPGDSRGSMQKLVDALLAPGGDALAQVEGIGINCTHPRYLPSLTRDLTREAKTYWTNLQGPRGMLRLLLYPDGGKEWDPVLRGFKPGGVSFDEWVADVREAVCLATDSEYNSQVWGEIVVGGCCNTSPEHIRRLADGILISSLPVVGSSRSFHTTARSEGING